MKMRTLTGVSWAVAVTTAAALLATAAPASAENTTPYERPTLVAAGSGYAAELQADVNFWTVNRLALAGLNDDYGDGKGQGSDVIVEPTGGGDALSATYTGSGLISKTAGKLFTRRSVPGHEDSWIWSTCSANVVNSANQSVVLTAGHCFRQDSSNWDFGIGFENWVTTKAVFIPGFNGAALARWNPASGAGTTLPGTDIAPYGVWGVTRQWTTNEWAADASHFGEGPGHDMAAFLVDSPTDSRPIQQVTGGQQVGFNLPQGKALTGFGYSTDNANNWYKTPYVNGVPTRTGPGETNVNGVPSALQRSFDGRTLKVSSGQSTGITGKYLDVLPAAISPGASGGPWFEQYDPATGTGIQVGVTSHFVNADGGTPVLETIQHPQKNTARPYMSATHFMAQEKAVYDLAQAQVAPN
ncbi:trypsin-like serine peptidase [Rhodococcus tukisamuensis]|uniref:V8-like Glu-specific endopeptidase n=1 Tax=Rhodococcus tukisamuensis TaxID=168276 RepID=A0A1G6SL47_9NOCA|nr:hypothetical protein [Rhodococcus tukisamuensis]SDD17513.1 hypothetical protein SAMN05444580_103179 [Rhodococcus tukisamuensis]